jgi:putative oxidoreductase
MLESIFSSPSSWGLLILRLALGITFFEHGWMKLNPNGPMKGPAGFAAGLRQMGVPLPSFFAWVVALLETIGAALLVLGLGTPILAIGFAIDMLVATMLVKRAMMHAAFMDPKGGGWEFEFVLMAGALALFFTGAGSISLDYLLGIAVPNTAILYAGAFVVVGLILVALFISQGRRAAGREQPKSV